MSERNDAYRRHVELSFDYDRMFRSQIIYEATALEGQLENIIACHFCSDEDKHLSFIAFLFNRAEVPFSKKIEIVEAILNEHYADLLKDLPGLINKLNSVRNLRNKFAHSELVLSEERLKEVPKGLYLRRINRDGKVIEDFIKSEDADKNIATANNLGFFVFYLYLEIRNRIKGEKHNQLKGFLAALKAKYPGTFAEAVRPEHAARAEPA